MSLASSIVKFCYVKGIDTSSEGAWEKAVFHSTHKEFFMQAQQYDPSGKQVTFREILSANPKAEAMHYLVSTAASGYLQALHRYIPDVRNDAMEPCLMFGNFRFEIIQSHRLEAALHRIQITFYSEPLWCIDAYGDRLLLTAVHHYDRFLKGAEVGTHTLSPWPGLSICSIQSIGRGSYEQQ